MNRRSTPNVFTLDKICKGLDMTIAQFFSPDNELVDLTDDEKNIITMWNDMSDSQKQLVLAYMQGIKDAIAANEK